MWLTGGVSASAEEQNARVEADEKRRKERKRDLWESELEDES